MHDDEQQQRERISALVDGQLDAAAFTHTLTWLASSGEARATWHAYHVLGDALRCPDLADCGEDQGFLDRLRVRLAHAEPADGLDVGAEQISSSEQVPARLVSVGSVETVIAPQHVVQVANDAVLRWQWLAAVASVMAVAILGWHVGMVSTTQLAVARDQLAPAIASGPVPGAESPVMLRDPRLDELLAAHRQFGGTSALQMPNGFLRNATFAPPER